MTEDAAAKAVLRARILAARNALPPEDRAALGAEIVRRLIALPSYRAAATVALYNAFRSELDTGPLIDDALRAGKRVLLPRVVPGPALELRRVTDPARDLGPGAYGIREPLEDRCPPVPVAEADWVLVPGVAFGREGQRLGYGAGFYDRLLEGARPDAVLCGAAFELQIADGIPMAAHDRPVDVVVTEAGVWMSAGKGGA